MDSEILHLVASNIRNQTYGRVLTIGGQRCGLQQRRKVWIGLAIVDIRPTSKQAVGRVELMIETYRELIPIDSLRRNCLKTSRAHICLRIIGEHCGDACGTIREGQNYVENSGAANLGAHPAGARL